MALLSTFPPIAVGQEPASNDGYFLRDMGKYFSAPTRWNGDEWIKFGMIAGGTIVVAEGYDDTWKKEMTTEKYPDYFKQIDNFGETWGNLSLSGAFMLGVYGYGRWNNDAQYLRASHNMLQSVVYTGAMTTVLKLAFQRDRPNVSNNDPGWFNSGKSFPSGHTGVAFSVSHAYLNSLENPTIATQVLYYGLATSTAWARTFENKHWASDVLAGALIGIYTADFVSDQNKKHWNHTSYMPYMNGETIGLLVRW